VNHGNAIAIEGRQLLLRRPSSLSPRGTSASGVTASTVATSAHWSSDGACGGIVLLLLLLPAAAASKLAAVKLAETPRSGYYWIASSNTTMHVRGRRSLKTCWLQLQHWMLDSLQAWSQLWLFWRLCLL
jgi:hypothetical protein